MRYLNLAKHIIASNFRRLSFPYKLTFAVTYACNYKCKTCNIWQRSPSGELTSDEIGRFFSKSTEFNWIDFTGGEVWLRKDFTEIVHNALAGCKDLVMVHFPTNGYLTDQIVNGVEKILNKRPPKLVITVSMDGDEALNDHIRGVKGGWRRQMDTFTALRSMPGVEVVLGMTLSPFNAGEYETAFEAVKQAYPLLDPKDFHMNVMHESSHYYGNSNMASTTDKQTKKVVEEVNRYSSLRQFSLNPINYIERRYLKYVERYLKTGKTPMRCHALSSSCFIDPSGGVYPCSMFNVRIAELRDHDYDLKKIWDMDRTIELQKEIWDYKCPQCWTPCEAYQSIFGNLLGLRDRPGEDSKGTGKSVAHSPSGPKA